MTTRLPFRSMIATVGLSVVGLVLVGGCDKPEATASSHRTSAHAITASYSTNHSDPSSDGPDVEAGQMLFAQSCAACHGQRAQGLPRQGLNLRTSRFIAGKSDDALLDFLRVGRRPNDPDTRLGLPMPPRGGNASLSDDRLRDVVAYLRAVQKNADGHTGTLAQTADISR